MSKLAQLREQRDIAAKEANELNAKHPADQRMPAADAEKLDKVLAKVESIDAEIDREVKMEKLNAAQAIENGEHARRDDKDQISDESKALRAFLMGGVSALTADQHKRMAARGGPDIRNAMSTTTPAEGGYTTAPEFYKALEQAMKLYGGMRQVASVIRTATGTQMNFPTADATSEVGEIVAQNATVARLDTTFGNITLDVYKYSSKDIAVPFELLQDSFIDVEAYILEVLAMRLGRIQNTHFTTGTGTGQPRGIVTASTVGKTGTTGQTTSVIYDDLVDLEHSVDPVYRGLPGVGFMFHDSTLKAVRKIKDTQNRPIFVPGYEQGNPGGAPDRLLGRPIYINQDMPVMAANAKSILFGAFSKYKIRDVMDLTMFRMTDSAFTRLGQVGFLGMNRVGGNLVDVGGAVKHYANSAT